MQKKPETVRYALTNMAVVCPSLQNTVWRVWEERLKPSKTEPQVSWRATDTCPAGHLRARHNHEDASLTCMLYIKWLLLPAILENSLWNDSYKQENHLSTVLKSALLNICSRTVKFQFPFPRFPFFSRCHFIACAVFRLCSLLVNPKDFPREKSISCQISFKAEDRGVASP